MNSVLVFLDFDGVLHPRVGAEPFQTACMQPLAKALEPYDIEIIVASTWRESMKLDVLKQKLAVLQKPVVAVTPVLNDPFRRYIRYQEVLEYLTVSKQQTVPWLAIDDTLGFYPAEAPVYWTDPATGFIASDIEPLQSMLMKL